MTMTALGFSLVGAKSTMGRQSREMEAIGRATQWINSPPLTAASLQGHVVLVQFGTYTCINWLRTQPYIRSWARKYQKDVTVIGVHTPEFAFEHDIDNVRRAMRQIGIEYPIVIDNDYAIWRAYRNEYWPALYVHDTRGQVRHRRFGEGEYEGSELALRKLVSHPGSDDGSESVTGSGVEAAADWSNLKSAETYLGSSRRPAFLAGSPFAGSWTIAREAARLAEPMGRITQRFHARDLHLVMGPSQFGDRIRFRVSLDGGRPGRAHGLDIDENGDGVALEQRLYQLIRQPSRIVDRQFAIEFLDAGVEAFAFTFG